MVGSLNMGLYRRSAIPAAPTLLRASLGQRRHPRIELESIPLVSYRTSSTTSPSSKLVISGKLKVFPLSISDFKEIREPGLAYFDKTEYISKLEDGPPVQLVCRPRRFGKSLTITMLRYFHGFQYRSQYKRLFKGLDVVKAVKKGTVKPGQYLILEFDFSRVIHFRDLDEAVESLRREINHGLARFRANYAKHLGETFTSETSTFIPNDPCGNLICLVGAVNHALQDIHMNSKKNHPLRDVQGIYLLADEYDACANTVMDLHDPKSWSYAEPFLLLKSFWSNVKASRKWSYGITRAHITGVIPLLLSDLVSGANDHENISFSPRISTICGLTRSDVQGALRTICKSEEEVDKHVRELEQHAYGYHFCNARSVSPVFNTQTALSYLQAVTEGECPQAEDPPNSEVSEDFLQICAGGLRL